MLELMFFHRTKTFLKMRGVELKALAIPENQKEPVSCESGLS